QTAAEAYVDAEKGFADVKAVLNGARDILAERFAEDADLLSSMREYLWKNGLLYSRVVEGKETEGANFRDWFVFSEPMRTIPSHRVLALLRGRAQGVLDLRLGLESELEEQVPHPCIHHVARHLQLGDAIFQPDATERERWLSDVCRWTWRVKLLPSFETEFITRLRETSEEEAIRVFAANLKYLLLATPPEP